MRTYALDEARVEFLDIVERALTGEPQRIVRDGAAVVMVSEAEWRGEPVRAAGPASAPTLVDLKGEPAFVRERTVVSWERPGGARNLGELLADFAEGVGFDEGDFDRPWTSERPRGSDFLDKDE